MRGTLIEDQGTSEAAFRSLLVPGERIIWSGHPGRGIRLGRDDWMRMPFAIFFVPFVLFWEYGATAGLRDGDTDLISYIFPLFGVFFFAVVGFQLFGKLFFDARRRANSVYAITDRRILILERGRSERLREENILAVDDTTIRRKKNGSGSIIIGPEAGFADLFMRRSLSTPRPFALEFLPDIDQVVGILRRQQIALRTRS